MPLPPQLARKRPPATRAARLRLRATIIVLLLVVCGSLAVSSPGEVRSPARPGSRFPGLATMPDGRIVMNWFEPGPDSTTLLRMALFDGRAWTPPCTIASGDSFFVNWADAPSVRPLGGDRLVAHWLWKSGEGTYAYDVRMSFSEDGGRTWSRAVTPHRDGTPTEHGFVSLLPAEGGARAVWLDGRRTGSHAGHEAGAMPEMTLRTAVVRPDGSLADEYELDARTCDCCPTAAVRTAERVLVAYRDRSPDEIRDIQLMGLRAGKWSEPRRVHADDWHMPGCPVNGPSLAAAGEHVTLAWYTAAGDSPRVRVATSEDGGEHFGAAARVDDGAPVGRVQALALDDGGSLVSWLESSGRAALLRVRRVSPAGAPGRAVTLARVAAARGTGYPRIARLGDEVLVAWTETAGRPHVTLARMRVR